MDLSITISLSLSVTITVLIQSKKCHSTEFICFLSGVTMKNVETEKNSLPLGLVAAV